MMIVEYGQPLWLSGFFADRGKPCPYIQSTSHVVPPLVAVRRRGLSLVGPSLYFLG